MLRDVCYPILPNHKCYNELREYLNKQFLIKRLIGSERYRMVSLNKKSNTFCNDNNNGIIGIGGGGGIGIHNKLNLTGLFSRLKKVSTADHCHLESYFELLLLNSFLSGLRQSPLLDRIYEETVWEHHNNQQLQQRQLSSNVTIKSDNDSLNNIEYCCNINNNDNNHSITNTTTNNNNNNSNNYTLKMMNTETPITMIPLRRSPRQKRTHPNYNLNELYRCKRRCQ